VLLTVVAVVDVPVAVVLEIVAVVEVPVAVVLERVSVVDVPVAVVDVPDSVVLETVSVVEVPVTVVLETVSVVEVCSTHTSADPDSSFMNPILQSVERREFVASLQVIVAGAAALATSAHSVHVMDPP
jgi:hypothetical protein